MPCNLTYSCIHATVSYHSIYAGTVQLYSVYMFDNYPVRW